MDKILFIIGAPRSGTTLLQHMLEVHPDIGTCPEPHLLTPLAHLGYYYNVDAAPYDHLNAAEAQKAFVNGLPRGEETYRQACRAYCDTLYLAMAEKLGCRIFLDKTPAYALVNDFLTTIFPDAYYLVLTRHPLAIFHSFADSFYNGDYATALEHNNIVGRYVPAIANLLRQPPAHLLQINYEQLVTTPEDELQKICQWLEIPYREEMVEYGKAADKSQLQKGFGDPKVKQSNRPNTKSLLAWAPALASSPTGLELARQVVAPLDPADVTLWGYNKDELFQPLAQQNNSYRPPKRKLDSYRIKRTIFLFLRPWAHRSWGRRLLTKTRYYCDVLLRK